MSKIEVDSKEYFSVREVPCVSLWYPRLDGHAKSVEVDLMDVRAADSIRVTYDFERDGWAISQASRFSWSADDHECDEDWQEVAFIQAWGRAETESQADDRIAEFEAAKGE